jgi:hypothetical protein
MRYYELAVGIAFIKTDDGLHHVLTITGGNGKLTIVYFKKEAIKDGKRVLAADNLCKVLQLAIQSRA